MQRISGKENSEQCSLAAMAFYLCANNASNTLQFATILFEVQGLNNSQSKQKALIG